MMLYLPASDILHVVQITGSNTSQTKLKHRQIISQVCQILSQEIPPLGYKCLKLNIKFFTIKGFTV